LIFYLQSCINTQQILDICIIEYGLLIQIARDSYPFGNLLVHRKLVLFKHRKNEMKTSTYR